MGQGGDIASTLALDTLREVFRADPTADGLLRAVHDANHVVWKHVTADPDRDDIGGTTLTAHRRLTALPTPRPAPRATDPRPHRGGGFGATGELSAKQAHTHPQRDLLTHALGIAPDLTANLTTLDCRTGDRLLICTDGLFNDVPENAITTAAATVDDPNSVALHLIDLANAAGGNDNISVVVIDSTSRRPTTPSPAAPSPIAEPIRTRLLQRSLRNLRPGAADSPDPQLSPSTRLPAPDRSPNPSPVPGRTQE
ncbi:hypothetical protein ST47_g1021 [Ascochyta rabiei]|uniref:Uncharacterized protein n=1 Tax=Didymella rabiei TaxID=5454 RepID=A0A163LIX1_DIDRA|nr:hypothetical protein ST47_g1021 [Ascochyta rabiei]